MIIKPKGISINHDVYQLIKIKQLELNGKSGKYFKIIDIADMAIRSGIIDIGLDKNNRLSLIKPIIIEE